jgi:hypothetical protein
MELNICHSSHNFLSIPQELIEIILQFSDAKTFFSCSKTSTQLRIINIRTFPKSPIYIRAPCIPYIYRKFISNAMISSKNSKCQNCDWLHIFNDCPNLKTFRCVRSIRMSGITNYSIEYMYINIIYDITNCVFTNLKTLSINTITKVNINNFPKINTLKIRENSHVMTYNNIIAFKRIKRIYLGSCQITDNYIGLLENLEEIFLDNNTVLTPRIINLPNLTKIHIGNNKFFGILGKFLHEGRTVEILK